MNLVVVDLVHAASLQRLADCAPARGELDRLRTLARGAARVGYSRDTGPLTACSYHELLTLADAGQRRHVSDYFAGYRAYARRRLLAKGAAIELLAERVHKLVRAEVGYRVDTSGLLAAQPPSASFRATTEATSSSSDCAPVRAGPTQR